jgi:hypothetical protein
MPSHKTATVLLSLLLATTANAVDEFSSIDFCKDLSTIAKEIMTARQQNRPMSETLPRATDRVKEWGDKYGLEMDMEEAEEAAAGMVMAAYEVMISTNEEFRQDRVTEFENDIFKECYKGLTSDSKE